MVSALELLQNAYKTATGGDPIELGLGRETKIEPQGPRMQSGNVALATRLKAAGVKLSEDYLKAMSDNNEGGDHVAAPGASFTVGDSVGQGAYGLVYRVTVTDPTPEFRAANPQLFDGETPRADLVIKFPRHLISPILAPRWYDPIEALAAEVRDANFFSEHLADAPIPGAEVLYAGDGPPPYAIKPFAPGASVNKLGKTQGGELTEAQTEALRTQIFAKAERVYKATGVSLDIKPANLAWSEEKQTWLMYELTRLPQPLATYFIGKGFEAYLEIIRATMQGTGNG